MRPTLGQLEQRDRDELAERRAERDRERETCGRRPRARTDGLTRQRAFGARVVDSVNVATAAAGDAVVELECPACRGPVFAPKDSDGEGVDCYTCDARLVTHRSLDGEITVLLFEPRLPTSGSDGAP